MKVYFELATELQTRPDAGIAPDASVWAAAADKVSGLSDAMMELMYAIILFYNKADTPQALERTLLSKAFPYDIKPLSETGGVTVHPQKLPPVLQNMLLLFLEKA